MPSTDLLPGLPGGPTAEPAHLGDALAVALWRQLASRPAADRRVVWRSLDGRLRSTECFGRSSRGARTELCRRSLLLCVESTGRVPSRRSYDAWRRGVSDGREWASA